MDQEQPINLMRAYKSLGSGEIKISLKPLEYENS